MHRRIPDLHQSSYVPWIADGYSPPLGPPPASQPDGMDIFRKLWRCRYMVLGAAAAGGIVAAGIAATLTPRYSAEAEVLIGNQIPNVTNLPEVLRQITPDQEVVLSESYVLQSRGLAGTVVNRLALDQDPEFNPALREKPVWRQYLNDAKSFVKASLIEPLLGGGEAAAGSGGHQLSQEQIEERKRQIVVSQLQSRITVVPLQRSHVLSVAAESEDPDTAARVANSLVDTYVEQQSVRRVTAAKDANQWLDQRIADLRQKVEQSERAVAEYRRKNGLYQAHNEEITAQQLSELNSQLIVAEAEQASAESRLTQAKNAKRQGLPWDSLPEVLNSPTIQTLKQQQTQLESEKAELANTFGPQHPRMLDIRSQLSDIKKKIDVEVNRVIASLSHQVDAAKARSEALRTHLGGLKQDMGKVNEKSIGLNQLERQAEANRRVLVSFLDRAKETAEQPNTKEQSAVVISQAAVPLGPSYPPTTMLVLLGVVGGTLLGMAGGLLRENLDRTFRTTRQVEEVTQLPVLGVLPSMDRRAFTATGRPGRAGSPFGQAVRGLFERIAFAPHSQIPKVVMLTSATPQEGKSRIVMSLIRLAGDSGLRVIALDCDWHRPVLHSFFSRPMAPGLGDLLAGSATPDEVVFQDPDSGVHAIFAGDVGQLSSSVERFARLRLLLGTLTKHYDLVIIDTPPVLAGADAMALAQMTQEVAFVVRWGHTPRDVILDAINHLSLTEARVGGVILSDVDPKRYRRYGSGDAVYGYANMHAMGTA